MTQTATSLIADREVAEGYIAKVCFKTGPPALVGAELEWTVHHTGEPTRPLLASTLAGALGEHAPPAIRAGSPHRPLPGGGQVTVEPGGQVEISTRPDGSLIDLIRTAAADIDRLERLLSPAGLRLGSQGCDPHRPPRRIVHSKRYQAMERAFDRVGPDGRAMMCGTAGVQVCLDAGEPHRLAARWHALHALGPPLLALFANSPNHAGRGPRWVSHRMRTWFGVDPIRTRPPDRSADPVAAWARRVLDTPLLCVRRPAGGWDAPDGRTFADWIAGALGDPPTFDDLSYHLGTLFPPVRARGHFEVRYLDAQPGDGWVLPVAMLGALFAREETVDAAAAIAEPAADRWLEAAREGLTDPVIGAVMPALIDLTCHAFGDTDLTPELITDLSERLHAHAVRKEGEAGDDNADLEDRTHG